MSLHIISIGTMQEKHRPFLPFSTIFDNLNFFLSSKYDDSILQLATLLNRFHIFFSLFSSFPVYYPFSDRGSFCPAFNNPPLPLAWTTAKRPYAVSYTGALLSTHPTPLQSEMSDMSFLFYRCVPLSPSKHRAAALAAALWKVSFDAQNRCIWYVVPLYVTCWSDTRHI